jgi:hypothetical protein
LTKLDNGNKIRGLTVVDGQVGFTPMCLDPVRGFISLLVASLFGAAPAEVLAVKPTRMRLLRLAFAVHKHRRAAAEIGLTDPNRKRPPRLTETWFC